MRVLRTPADVELEGERKERRRQGREEGVERGELTLANESECPETGLAPLISVTKTENPSGPLGG